VAIARELRAISEEHTPLNSTALKEETRAEAKRLMVVGGDPVLVRLMDKYVGAVFLDADGNKTYVVRVVQYDEREEEV
jgi:hypothetical protein